MANSPGVTRFILSVPSARWHETVADNRRAKSARRPDLDEAREMRNSRGSAAGCGRTIEVRGESDDNDVAAEPVVHVTPGACPD